jgi:hypothetical protein
MTSEGIDGLLVSVRPQDGQRSSLTPAEWREVCASSVGHGPALGHENRRRVLQYQTTTPPTTGD